MEQKWLTWAKEIQAIAQTGLTYAKDVYDIERYQALRELSVDILANYTFESKERIRLSFAGEGVMLPQKLMSVVLYSGRIKFYLFARIWTGIGRFLVAGGHWAVAERSCCERNQRGIGF